MKIAITGTTSGIGQSTMELLESKGHEVFSINRPEWDHHDLDNLSKINLQTLATLKSMDLNLK